MLKRYQVFHFTLLDEWPRNYECLATGPYAAIAALHRDEKDIDDTYGFFVFDQKGFLFHVKQLSL